MTRATATSRKSTPRRAKASKRATPSRAGKPKRAVKQPGPKPRAAAPKRRAANKPAAKKPAAKKPKPATPSRWLHFVEQFGVVLASAKGPVPSLAEQIAGEPIIGSWWSHPRAHEIFDALSTIDDDVDVRCFKLVEGKVTFVHRRLWPALVRLARDGVLPPERVASIQQEHMPTGEHRNVVTPFPDWVPDDAAEAADALSVEAARHRLGGWL